MVECQVVIVGIILLRNGAPIVHSVCLQNDFEISNEALRSVERKEKDRI